MIDWRIVTFLCFYERNYVAGDCERDNILRWCEKRDETKGKTKRWGILKKSMTKERSTTSRTGK